MRTYVAAGVAALAVLVQSAGVMRAQEVDIPYTKFVLPNGLTVLIHEDHKAPVVALNIWYHVGSKNEVVGKTGFAHLFEHLMFGGSENLHDRYINIMEGVGATNLNGTTSEDRTNYFETVPASAFDYALFAESDRMGHFYSTINKETLDTQRGVVQNEKRQDENQPYAIAYEMVGSAPYPASHPYAHTVIGSLEDLNGASLEDVKTWFKTYYGPSNAVLAIAGDVDTAVAKEKVKKYFGDIEPGPPVLHPKAWTAKLSGMRRETIEDRVPLGRMFKVWNVPGFGTPEADYLMLADSVLSSGKSSRLYKRLVYDDQIATNVQTILDDKEVGGQFIISVTAKAGKSLDLIEKEVDEELARFLKDGPTESELNRAKTEHMARFIRGLDRVGGFGGKSDVLASYQTYTGSADNYKVSLSRVEKATAADVKATANAWLEDGVYVLDVLPFPRYKTTVETTDRSKLPAVADPPESRLPALQKTTLANGLKVVLAERHEIPLVNFWLSVNAGYAADQFAVPGTAKLTSALMMNGTEKRNALEISDEAQSLGATLDVSSDLDLTTVSLSALKNKLDPSMDLFADVVLHPSFPESDFKRLKSLQTAAIENEQSQPFSIAARILPQLLYGKGNAYAVPLTGSGTKSSVEQITRESLVKFRQSWFKPNNATLVIVGDIKMDEIRPKLERLFAAWKPGEVPAKNLGKVEQPKKADVYIIDKPGAPQSLIIAGTIAPPKNSSQDIALEAMNSVFGGEFNSRLNMNLREDKHWSYGAESFAMNAKAQRPFFFYAPVQTDKTKESLLEVEKELTGIVGPKPITEEELKRIQRQDLLQMAGSRETMQAVGRAIRDLSEYDLPANYWDTYDTKIRELTTGTVNDEAKSFFHPDKLIWVIVGDRAKIEEGVRSAGLGGIRYMTPEGVEVGAPGSGASLTPKETRE